MEILQNLFRTLMFFLDNIVYGLVPQIYKLFIYLSELNLFGDNSDNPLQALVSHIYVLLGMFMLFKVSFSLLQYLVDPNAFRDSSKGMGKLVTNVLVALVLLVSVPSIFSMANRLQSVIISSNAIGQLILGTNASGNGSASIEASGKISKDGVEEMARDLQFMLFGAFYNLNTNLSTFSACQGTSGVFGSVDMATANDGGCLDAIQENLPDDATSNGVSLYSFFKHTGSGENCNENFCDDRNFAHFDKLLWWKIDGEYVINYLPFISTLAGGYVVFLLISFSIDIAVRAIKLCFLQMVAPIAIVSYIDPKESISNGKLYNWIKECASTYFSLFLRLASIFLVMLLVSSLASSVLADGGHISAQINDSDYSIWIYLFLIIGAFMFAKQLPKIIENIFGLKGTGEFNLNPFKNPALTAGLGMTIGGAAGLSAGLRAGAAAGAPVRGALGGVMSGVRQGFSTNKLSPDLYRKTRKSIYKDFTGNELATFNPYQKLMGIGGEKKVAEVSQPLNKARKQMNEAQTRLGVYSRITSESGATLRKKLSPEQMKDLAKTQKDLTDRRNESQNKLNGLMREKETMENLRHQSQQQLDKVNGHLNSGIVLDNKTSADLRAQREKLMAEIDKHNNSIVDVDQQVKHYQAQVRSDGELIDTIGRYNDAIDKENELRGEIASIQKDIDTLSDEKRQRQRFYGVESSSKQDVSQAMENIANRDNDLNSNSFNLNN